MEGSSSRATGCPTIGLVGVGNWGRHILRDLISLGCEVHVVARSAESIERAREQGATSIVNSIDHLPELDAAIAAPIATQHAVVVEQLAEHTAGPIFCEKPLTADVAEAERIVATLADRVFVMDKWRYHAGVREMARLAQSGELGEVRGVAMRRVSTRNPHPDVNTLWTHAPHDLTIALEILGELPPLRVAVGEVVGGEIHGAVAILGSKPWITIEVTDFAPDHRREMRVVGSDATVILDGGWAESVTIRRIGADDEVVETPGELPLLAELRAFVDHVRGGPPPRSTAAEGLLVVRRIQEIIDVVMADSRVTA